MIEPVVAGIDLGTNSLRIVIATRKFGQLVVLFEHRDVTRIGELVDRTSTLQPVPMQRTLAVLREYKQKMDYYGVTNYSFIGTSALRDIEDTSIFYNELNKIPLTMTILSGHEEAELVADTVLCTVSPILSPAVLVDQGGGSTEFVLLVDQKVQFMKSLDIGVVRLTEQFLSKECPTINDIQCVKEHLSRSFLALNQFSDVMLNQLIVLGGTGTTVSRLEQALAHYAAEQIHGSQISLSFLEYTLAKAIVCTHHEKEEYFHVEQLRADVMIAGIIELIAIMQLFGVDCATVSDKGLRYGLVHRLLMN